MRVTRRESVENIFSTQGDLELSHGQMAQLQERKMAV